MNKNAEKPAAYFDEGEFTDNVQRVVGNDDLAVVVNPSLTSDQIVNARRGFVPRVQLSRPATVSSFQRSYIGIPV